MALNLMNIDDAVSFDICMFLEPQSLWRLQAANQQFHEKVTPAAAQSLFCQQMQDKLATAAQTQSDDCSSFAGVMSVASKVQAVADVFSASVQHPFLASHQDFAAVREAIGMIHDCALHGTSLQAVERSGRSTPLAKKMFRKFAVGSDILGSIVLLLRTFRKGLLPVDIFVKICECLTVLVSGSEKVRFVKSGGLKAVFACLHKHHSNTEVQSATMALLVSLSVKSISNIQAMIQSGVHEFVAATLASYAPDSEVFSRGMALFANFSNIPQAAPALCMCGAVDIAQSLIVKAQQQRIAPQALQFAERLVENMPECNSH